MILRTPTGATSTLDRVSTEEGIADQHGEIAVVDGESASAESAEPADSAGDAGSSAGSSDGTAPSWWHREHPVFAPLSGFFTGMFFIILVPGLYGAVLNWLLDYDTAESLFPFVVVILAIPIGLVVAPRSRRFGRYMLLGIVSTLLVVGVVAGAVLWFLINSQA